jgi:hypothetical protein
MEKPMTYQRKYMHPMEYAIAKKLCEDLIAAGYGLIVDDYQQECDEENVAPSHDINLVMEHVDALADESHVFCYKPGSEAVYPQCDSWIYLVYGNRVDILSDYTTDLEQVLYSAMKWIEEIDNGSYAIVSQIGNDTMRDALVQAEKFITEVSAAMSFVEPDADDVLRVIREALGEGRRK